MLRREIYNFTHERQPLKLDSNQHSAISRSFYRLNYLSDEVWCEPVHCSLFFQYHHDTCTIAEPNHIYRTHFSFYAGTLIGALPQCVIRKLYRSSRSTSHGSSIECSPLPDSNRTARLMKGIWMSVALAKLSDVRTDWRIIQGTHGNSFNAPSLT